MKDFGDVVILFNTPRGPGGGTAGQWTESDAGVLKEVNAVAEALGTLDIPHRKAGISTLAQAGQVLGLSRGSGPVVNLVESLPGSVFDACLVPAVCSAAGRRYTGNSTPCHVLSLDKWLAKCAMQADGVPVPAGAVLPPGCDVSAVRLPPPPLIVKPLRTDASEGIDATSVIHEGGADRVAAVARRIHEQFGQPALAEQFIDGREVNVSLIERDGSLAVLPLAEIDFSAFAPSQPRIVDYAAKWIEDSFAYRNTPRRIPAALDETVACRVRECARAAWNALGCRDYVRVDIRVDAQGTPFVIEVNANPDISPDAGFAAALAAGGLSFADFVLCLLRNASGGEFAAAPAAGPAPGEPGAGRLLIRWSLQSDRDPVLQIVRAAGVFRPREIAVAEEVLDSALAAGTRGHYQSYTAVLNDQILGWICFGSTPCTESTFDIYWIAVSRDAQRGGVGSSLLAHAEQLMRARGGTMAVADTSGRTSYEPAQGFYVRHGFRLTARVPDFYEKGDEKLVFAKPL